MILELKVVVGLPTSIHGILDPYSGVSKGLFESQHVTDVPTRASMKSRVNLHVHTIWCS